MARQYHKSYAFGTAAIFVSGLSMMALVVMSAWLMAAYFVESEEISSGALGTTDTLALGDSRLGFLDGLGVSSGQVAGVVDDSSIVESQLRNHVADWMSEVRSIQGLDPAYRDGVLDRNAQNQARLLAGTCDIDQYSDWTAMLGSRVDEGFIRSFSEATFVIDQSSDISTDFPLREVNYNRIFTVYDAYGVGVAEQPVQSGCSGGKVIVLHMAGVN